MSARAAIVGAAGPLLLACLASCRAGVPPPEAEPVPEDPLVRRYVPGEVVRYEILGVHEGRESTRRYAAECEGRVMQTPAGTFFEELAWTRLTVGGRDVPLDGRSRAFRQRASLDARHPVELPDIRGVHPLLVGPILDLVTFYVDAHPDLHRGRLLRRGDTLEVPHGAPNSWADGQRVILGEDCIDFVLVLADVGPGRARLCVRHQPPRVSSIRLPADWMRAPVVGDVANNWVQVVRDEGGAERAFAAAAGHEVFDVELTLERPSGRILAATMDNPVDVVQRVCRDEALQDCGEPVRYRIHRRIELRARP